jgi:hypothetical protein
LAGSLSAAEPVTSGVPVGRRPGPYSFLVASGPERGKQHCYICETEDKAAAVVMARKLTPELAALMGRLDAAIAKKPAGTLRGWMTVLGEKTVTPDDLEAWAKAAGLKAMPSGVFDRPEGPPAYTLDEAAEVTVMLFVNKKVTHNFAFRAGELSAAEAAKVEAALDELAAKAKP